MIRKIVTSMIALLFVLTLFTPVFADDGGTTTQIEETQAFCESGKTHPGIAKMSAIFDLDQNVVKEYYCMGYGLGAIRLALRAAALDPSVNVVELLEEMEDEEFEEEEFEADDLETEDQEKEGTDDEKESVYCEKLDTMVHPTGMRYAELLSKINPDGEIDGDTETNYEIVMGWFCDENLGFGEIKHLLNTSVDSIFTLDELLEMRAEMGWGEIWQEAGLIGQGKPKVHPVFGENWPNDKGPQDKGKPVDAGPPVGKGKPGK
jgi:hypothetical protein